MMFECPGAKNFKQPQPENIKCPVCGNEVEIWTDEFQAICPKCKKTVGRQEGQSCLDWCKSAKECVGDEVYSNYLKNKKRRKQ